MGATLLQKTLSAPIEFVGVGLHTGEECHLTMRPAHDDAGIVFFRRDAKQPSGKLRIAAAPENVVRACHGTTLANESGLSVMTVEHLMAALAICGVDNAEIDVYGPEAPILDGSSRLFVEAVNAVGLAEQSAPRREIVLEEPFHLADGDRSIHIDPSDEFRLDVTIEFEDCLIGRQSQSLHFGDPAALERMAKSRTFCRLHEVEALRAMDLIRGGSLDNSIVVDGTRLLNGDELRDPYEFVLHKALDLIGDLYLLGAPIRGAINAVRPGHDLNTRAARALAGRYLADGAEAAPERLAATA